MSSNQRAMFCRRTFIGSLRSSAVRSAIGGDELEIISTHSEPDIDVASLAEDAQEDSAVLILPRDRCETVGRASAA